MINWKLRFKNKVTLVSLVTLVVSILYQILNMIGIIPTIDQQEIIDVLCRCIDVLALLGIVVDPTTSGVSDSEQAMGYSEPRKDDIEVKEGE